jgi:hypothetical protein
MAIRGAEGMNDRDLGALIDQGARVVVFSYCVSLLILTLRRNATVLVRPGQTVANAALPYTLLSLFVGWWGFPFGLIFTPIAIMQNLNGGTDVTAQVRSKIGAAVLTSALAAGRAVLVPWKDGQIYQGTVLDLRAGQVHVRFGNGTDQWVPAEHVRPA